MKHEEARERLLENPETRRAYLAQADERERQMVEFMRLMPVHPAFNAKSVLEVYLSWRDGGMLDFLNRLAVAQRDAS